MKLQILALTLLAPLALQGSQQNANASANASASVRAAIAADINQNEVDQKNGDAALSTDEVLVITQMLLVRDIAQRNADQKAAAELAGAYRGQFGRAITPSAMPGANTEGVPSQSAASVSGETDHKTAASEPRNSNNTHEIDQKAGGNTYLAEIAATEFGTALGYRLGRAAAQAAVPRTNNQIILSQPPVLLSNEVDNKTATSDFGASTDTVAALTAEQIIKIFSQKAANLVDQVTEENWVNMLWKMLPPAEFVERCNATELVRALNIQSQESRTHFNATIGQTMRVMVKPTTEEVDAAGLREMLNVAHAFNDEQGSLETVHNQQVREQIVNTYVYQMLCITFARNVGASPRDPKLINQLSFDAAAQLAATIKNFQSLIWGGYFRGDQPAPRVVLGFDFTPEFCASTRIQRHAAACNKYPYMHDPYSLYQVTQRALTRSWSEGEEILQHALPIRPLQNIVLDYVDNSQDRSLSQLVPYRLIDPYRRERVAKFFNLDEANSFNRFLNRLLRGLGGPSNALDFSHCALTRIDEQDIDLVLQKFAQHIVRSDMPILHWFKAIYLRCNALTNIPSLQDFEACVTLDLAHNRLTQLAPGTLPERIINLNLAHNQFLEIPADVYRLAQARAKERAKGYGALNLIVDLSGNPLLTNAVEQKKLAQLEALGVKVVTDTPKHQ